MLEVDAIPFDSNGLVPSFCGKKCKEVPFFFRLPAYNYIKILA
jgi:hypothetical protein